MLNQEKLTVKTQEAFNVAVQTATNRRNTEILPYHLDKAAHGAIQQEDARCSGLVQ